MKSTVIYDNWLDKYLSKFTKDTVVLDLGCGMGNNTKYLISKGFKVIAADFSKVALETVKKNYPQTETVCLDLSDPLPFNDNHFSVIVADLCLHYFDSEKTKEIMLELKRILKPRGVLLARVNSINDFNHGAGKGEKLEENYYFVNGYKKRFFDVDNAREFFKLVGKTEIYEADMLRYAKPKKVIVIFVEKI